MGAMDRLAEEDWQSSQSWSKTAGTAKADVLCNVVQCAAEDGRVLEIGTYCGYTSVAMALALPDLLITTLEYDPTHVLVARNVLLLAGLAQRVNVWTGHSRHVLARLAGERQCSGEYAAIFMDRWGSQYYEDFLLLEGSGLLRQGCI